MVKSLACLAPGGRFLELGKRDLFDNTHVGLWPLRRNASYHAIDLSVLLTTPAARARRAATDASTDVPQSMRFESLRTVFAAAAAGELTPLPVRVLPASRAADAFRLMAQGGHVGKVLLDFTQHGNRVKRTPRRPSFRKEATYLVTGAFGGAGLMVASWLVDRGARHLALSSRHGPQSAAAYGQLEEFQRSGVDIRVFQCDVADAADLASMLDTIARDMPPLAGVFHLAMVLDDGRMLNLDRDRISRVIAPKLTGARNLHVHTRERPLQCFVLFGSVNASVGNSGQASYAAANAGLEQLARERRAAGLPATTIGWGMLGDAGYVAERPELVESVTQSGLSPLTTHDVREVLDFALTSEDAAIVAARVDWQRLSSRIGGRGSRVRQRRVRTGGTKHERCRRDHGGRSRRPSGSRPGTRAQNGRTCARHAGGEDQQRPAAYGDGARLPDGRGARGADRGGAWRHFPHERARARPHHRAYRGEHLACARCAGTFVGAF
jgi:NAD(P)-dependent dehydrogenase (short-subunit alcohol dehydrogenase family)